MARGEFQLHTIYKCLVVAFEVIQHSDGSGIISVIDSVLDNVHADGGEFESALVVMPEVLSAVLDDFFDVTGYE